MGSLTELAATLAWLYPERDQARRIARESDLDPSSIDFDGAPMLRWYRLLEAAEKHVGVDRVLAEARREYPAQAAKLKAQTETEAIPTNEAAAVRSIGAKEADARRGLPAIETARTRDRPSAPASSVASPPFPASLAEVSTGDGGIDFFVSYTARDKEWAVWIAWTLEAAGYRTVIQAWDFVPGSNFVLAMHRATVDARQTIAVLSPDYFQSSYAAPEWAAAVAEDPEGRKRKLVPVRVRECNPPGLWRGNVYIDLFGRDEKQARVDLLGGITGLRGKPSEPPAFPGQQNGAPPKVPAPHALTERGPAFPARGGGRAMVTVTVVGVEAELGAHLTAVVERLVRIPGIGAISRVDAADGRPPAFARRQLEIVLVGGQTGGTNVLADLLGRTPRPVTLKLERPDTDDLDPIELVAGQALRRAAREAPPFATPDQAAESAATAAAAWLEARAPVAAGEGLTLATWERSYLAQRLPSWRGGKPGPLLGLGGPHEMTLAAMYVPMRATTDVVYLHGQNGGDDNQIRFRARAGTDAVAGADTPERTQEDVRGLCVEHALCLPELPHLVIEGDPGAGKSSLICHVAYVLAREHTGTASDPTAPDAPHALDLRALAGDGGMLPVPIVIEAHALADALATDATRGFRGVLGALTSEIRAATATDISEDVIEAGLRAGRYLLLVDSLDEVPDEAGRQAVVNAIEGYLGDAERGGRSGGGRASRVVLTTRPWTYLGRVALGSRLRVLRIATLGAEEIAALTDRWCTLLGRDTAYRDRLREALGAIRDRHGGVDLAENPLLLVATCLVYGKGERLPDSTAELYERLVDTLLLTRRAGPAGRDDLEIVCEGLQRAGGTERPRAAVAADLRAARPKRHADIPAADAAIERIYRDTGLLRFEPRKNSKGRSYECVRPWHRSFQEYLCACCLAASAVSVPTTTDALFEPAASPIAVDPAWEGVLRFLVGVHGRMGWDRARAYLERLFDHAVGANGAPAHARTGRLLGLAASGLAEYEDFFEGHPLKERVRHEIVGRFEAGGAMWPLADRLLALEALGRLGDPRLDRDLWVDVPAGEFEMGGDNKACNSAPRHKVHLDAFRMSWRPITVHDFAPFVAAHGQNHTPADWAAQCFHPNRPVVEVNWEDAMAFCKWASVLWKLAVDLPTEAEWEYVARGTGRDVYPWGVAEPGEGDEARANYRGIWSPHAPTPVGAFPLGNRGRLVDLVGNVWQWCKDAWRDSSDPSWERDHSNPFHEAISGSGWIVRGGGWFSGPQDLRATARLRLLPTGWYGPVGFRVVCRGPLEQVAD